MPNKIKSTAHKIIDYSVITFLILLSVALIYLIIKLIPSIPVSGITIYRSESMNITVSAEQRLLILMALGGALGAFIHIATSYVDFLGNNELVYTWIAWYIMRPFIGAALAIIFYLVLRGGLFMPNLAPSEPGSITSSENSKIDSLLMLLNQFNGMADSALNSQPTDSMIAKTDSSCNELVTFFSETKEDANAPPVNPYGMLALACLVGMFSKNAIDKLREIFETLFKTDQPVVREDKLDGSTPDIGNEGAANADDTVKPR